MRMSTRIREVSIRSVLLGCALVSVATTIGIIVVLLVESIPFFRLVNPVDFLLGTRWAPLLEPRSFGVLPLLCGTMLVAGGALIIAVPIGLGSAMYLSEYAPGWLRAFAKPVLEVLAGVPTVVYGYFALTFITPKILQPLFPQTGVFNALSAAIVVGIMVLPTVCSLCDDALRAVPRTLHEAGHALAATRFEVATRIVLPSAMSGVVAAILLAFARAIGETMAVSLAAGITPQLTLNPLESVQTMTSFIVQVSFGDTPAGTIGYQTIFAVGLCLFLMTLAVNYASGFVVRRFREAYE